MSALGYAAIGGPRELDPLAAWEHYHALRLADLRTLIVPRPTRVAAPAAGAEWAATVPGGKVWIVLGVYAELTTSANATGRAPKLLLTDGQLTLAKIIPATTQPAVATYSYTYLRNGDAAIGVSNASGQLLPFPARPMPAGYTIGSLTQNIDVADQWANIALDILEVRERTAQELAGIFGDLLAGAHLDAYPGLLLGL